MSLREDMWKYEQITGESAEHVPIIKLGAFLDGYETGLKAVEQQPSEDVISRKAVLDVVRKWFDKMQLNGDICIDGIISLPSVTPRNNLAETSQDCISRQEAISAIQDKYYDNAIGIDIVDIVAHLPSVTPKAESEVVI